MKKLLCLIVCLSLCAAPALAAAFTDSAGRQVEIDAPSRVVTLFGSYGELWQLAGGTLVATTQDILARNPDMDLQNVGSYTEPSMETVFALEPDFVILSSGTPSHFAIAQTLEAAGIPCAFFDVLTWRDYMDAMKVMTDITGRADCYEAQVEAVQRPIESMIAEAQALQREDGQTALLLRASSTKVHAKGSEETVAGAILKDLGLVNLADGSSALSENLSVEAILIADPDWIFVTTMGLDGEAAQATLQATLMDNPAWSTLSAVREGRYALLDPMLFHYRPNARWAEAYRVILDLLEGADGDAAK